MKNKKISCVTNSPFQTKKLGGLLSREILKSRPGVDTLVLVLSGFLGAGKTNFVQGFAAGLGVKGTVNSPTFVILKRHVLPQNRAGFKNLYHIDCYRLDSAAGLKILGIAEILKKAENIVVIEWPEVAKGVLPKNVLALDFEMVGKNKRRIQISAKRKAKSVKLKTKR